MSLEAHSHLGNYEILEPIGAGGMGEPRELRIVVNGSTELGELVPVE